VQVIHHTDGECEQACDRASSIGRLDKELDEARANRWVAVNTKADWMKVIAPSAAALTAAPGRYFFTPSASRASASISVLSLYAT
jgi:hypothetical protein